MKNALTLIVVLHLLAHAVLGCCWHHDHDICQKSGHAELIDQVAVIAPSHGACSHGHHHEHQASTEGQERHEQPLPVDSCDGDKCHWLGKDTTELQFSLDTDGLISEIEFATVSAPCLLESGLRGNPPDVSAASPPVRTNLLYQILLI